MAVMAIEHMMVVSILFAYRYQLVLQLRDDIHSGRCSISVHSVTLFCLQYWWEGWIYLSLLSSLVKVLEVVKLSFLDWEVKSIN